ncbi:DUF5985 family protein [Massilia sp. H-1]|nr:DUF5985 family protein [Massilia sp. H-1]
MHGISLGSLLIALFFLRFWRDTGDRFFLLFALSFAIEGVHRAVASFDLASSEDSPFHYLLRLLAYLLILGAIADKNWPRKPRP